ncbi:MAG: alpha-amylase family glycosyl hydrolase, partial [Mucilaginibacter sp.]
HSDKVQEYNYKLFKSFVDPGNNGNFYEGVDGFRLDHMQDDLDGKGRLTNLFEVFWGPLIGRLKEVNPHLNFVAEQANWGSYGYEYLKKGHVDRVFAFNLQKAISSFDKANLIKAAHCTFNRMPTGKQQIVFIENHDMPRFSTEVQHDPGKLRVGAVLNLFIGGVPAIYYGQELGMTGAGGNNKFGITDGNDIPQREAFEWNKSDSGQGMTLWYKDTGPWWDQTNLKPDDGISLEEEKDDPNSLYNFYRSLLHIRKSHVALGTGRFKNLENDNPEVFSFTRYHSKKAVVVVVNLSGELQSVTITLEKSNFSTGFVSLYGKLNFSMASGQLSGELSPYSIDILELISRSKRNNG